MLRTPVPLIGALGVGKETLVPRLKSQKALQELRHLSFCYLCGRNFELDDDRNRDHVPPKSAFLILDRQRPLILPTHTVCNSLHKDVDEKIGQLIALKNHRIPEKKNRKLSIKFLRHPKTNATIAALDNLDIPAAIRRWLKGFHSALYSEPMPTDAKVALQTPFPSANLQSEKPALAPIPNQHGIFVQTMKMNRAAGRLDEIRTNNGKMAYECVWDKTEDGAWLCVFALDIYGWKDLGDIHNFSPRGCAGFYMLPSREAPPGAAKGTGLYIPVQNLDWLDPFGN